MKRGKKQTQEDTLCLSVEYLKDEKSTFNYHFLELMIRSFANNMQRYTHQRFIPVTRKEWRGVRVFEVSHPGWFHGFVHSGLKPDLHPLWTEVSSLATVSPTPGLLECNFR